MFKVDESLQNLTDARLVIRKVERRLDLLDQERIVKTYRVVLGFSPDADKRSEGDGRTPEGEYFICTKNPKSKFFLSLGLSYPGKEAAEGGLKEGIITQEEHDEILAAIAEKRMPLQKTGLGGEIYIHGGGVEADWTQGCIALADEQMAELFELVPVGAKVTILP
jgi:murein L,D-transpeptidase YafK